MGEAAHIARRAMSAPPPARPPQPLGTGGSSPGFEIKNPTSVVFFISLPQKGSQAECFPALVPACFLQAWRGGLSHRPIIERDAAEPGGGVENLQTHPGSEAVRREPNTPVAHTLRRFAYDR